jgi:hypothetical protein
MNNTVLAKIFDHPYYSVSRQIQKQVSPKIWNLTWRKIDLPVWEQHASQVRNKIFDKMDSMKL